MFRKESRKKFNIKNAAIIPNGIAKKLFEATLSDAGYIAYSRKVADPGDKGMDTLIKAMDTIHAKLEMAGKGEG